MGIDIAGVATMTAPGGILSLDGTVSNVMKVTPGGILTRSLTPYFRGQLTGKGGSYNAGGGSMLITADVNRGNCWNGSTGYFTCPIAGKYMVTCGNLAGQQAGYVWIQQNGGNAFMSHWNHMAAWHYVTASGILNCAAGDNIRYVLSGLTPGTNGFYGDGNHCMYSIALLA
jgi:hypothetical protein